MRFLLDENLSPVIAKKLRDRDIDAAAVARRGELRTMPDPVILAAAAANFRMPCTVA